jgi:glycolate oxidase iron-sulfur subunit
MQTSLADFIKETPEGKEADAILRTCVHCGFCTATCPTYQLLGDELDGPRGRIYLIKQVLEGQEYTRRTQIHLDRCLTCRSCETTCPSGVRYGRLADIGRQIVEQHVPRPLKERITRRLLRATIPYSNRFDRLLSLGQRVRPWLPANLKQKIPSKQTAAPWPQRKHTRRMLVLDSCGQPSASPNTNCAAARVLDRLGISLVRAQRAGCCGAMSYHLSAQAEGLQFARRNIDAWWPYVEAGAEAVVITASGCGTMVKEYGELLQHDPEYADKAARISALTKDLSEVLGDLDRTDLKAQAGGRKIAFHSPCSLQHGQKLTGAVERILGDAGFNLTPVADAHLCCGSAGTYSILQQALSRQLLDNKIRDLENGEPGVIATANIGCLLHLQTAARVPVKHWIELLDEACGA